MASFTAKDVELLGYVEPKELTPKGAALWSVYSATATAGLEQLSATFVYLKSDCTREAVAEAARFLKSEGRFYVIHPNSLRLTNLSSIFGRSAQVRSHEDLIWAKLHKIFGDYVASLMESIAPEKYYVNPRKEGASPEHRLDEELLDYLRGKGAIHPGELAVVCASAGVGKTTLARHIIRRLATNLDRERIVPIFVEASHWSRLQLDSFEELWEIIRNSLHTFSASVDIKKDLFEYALKQGYLAFVFDGFDELCSHRSSPFRPNEILGSLADIAKESDARIILTTRSLYWQAEVRNPPANVKTLHLAPFNTQQAKGYFDKSLEKAPLRDRAYSLYKEVIAGSRAPQTSGGARAQFVNLPLCVVMIAEYVRLGGEGLANAQPNQLLEEILRRICDREVERKNLVTKADAQLTAFEAIAVEEFAKLNPEFDLELLDATGISPLDIPKLIDHPLLTKTSADKYKFAFEFLGSYLRAIYLARVLRGAANSNLQDAWKILVHEANGRGFVLEHLVPLLGPSSLDDMTVLYAKVPTEFREAKSFLFHLAQAVVADDSHFVTIEERTDAVLGVLGAEKIGKVHKIAKAYITGPAERLALAGAQFRYSTFHEVAFDECEVDTETVFESCTFSGEVSFGRDKAAWSVVKLTNCTLLSPANLAWDSILEISLENSAEQVKDALRLGLSKFWHSGRLKGSIRKEDWTKGILGQTRYSKPLLDAMLRCGLIQEVATSGVAEGSYAFDRQSIPDLQRFMDNRQITGKINDVFQILKRDQP